MPLIKCPECGKEISDRASTCINCGFPLKKENICKINGAKHDLSCILDMVNSGTTNVEVIQRKIQEKVCDIHLSLQEYYKLAYIIINTKAVPTEFNHAITPSKQICCPHCGSTAITTGARGVNWTLGLIGASKTVNRCGKCGHMWEPKR